MDRLIARAFGDGRHSALRATGSIEGLHASARLGNSERSILELSGQLVSHYARGAAVKKLLNSLEKSDLDGYGASVKALYGLRQRDRVKAKNYTGGRASKVPLEKARTRIRETGKREIKNSLSRRDNHNQKIIGDSIGKLHDALVQRGEAGKRTLEMSRKLAGDIPRWSQQQIDRNTKESDNLPFASVGKSRYRSQSARGLSPGRLVLDHCLTPLLGRPIEVSIRPAKEQNPWHPSSQRCSSEWSLGSTKFLSQKLSEHANQRTASQRRCRRSRAHLSGTPRMALSSLLCADGD